MKYCENCMVLGAFTACPVCGSKDIRDGRAEDYCYLTECAQGAGMLLDSYFAEAGIVAVMMPMGNGARSALGMTLENYRIFVRFNELDRAREIMTALANEAVDRLRVDLLAHFDKWHYRKASSEKKLRKKLKLAKDADVLAYVKAQVEKTDYIADGGPRHVGGGHILSVRTENGSVLFDSLSYEILI